MNYLDLLLEPLLPGPEFSYLPYTIMLYLVLITAAFWFLVVYFKRALLTSGWTARKQYNTIRIFILIVISYATISLIIGRTEIIDDPQFIKIGLGFIMLIPCLAILFLTRNKSAVQLLDIMPDALLINANMFRVIIEPSAYLLNLEEQIPRSITIQGDNPEIMIAFSAPIMIALFFNDDVKRYNIAIAWNFLGLMSLGYFIYLILNMSPDFNRYYIVGDPAYIMTSFPFILYSSLYVPVAFGLHALSIKQLLRDKKNPIKYDISYLNPE